MIRRMYYLYTDQREFIIKPLNLVLSHIAVYSVRNVEGASIRVLLGHWNQLLMAAIVLIGTSILTF